MIHMKVSVSASGVQPDGCRRQNVSITIYVAPKEATVVTSVTTKPTHLVHKSTSIFISSDTEVFIAELFVLVMFRESRKYKRLNRTFRSTNFEKTVYSFAFQYVSIVASFLKDIFEKRL